MLVYHFDYHVDDSRTITLELPADAPTGLVQIIVPFPEAPSQDGDTPHTVVDSGLSGAMGLSKEPTPMPPILTLPRTHASALTAQGCWPVADWAFLAHATWLERAQAVHDETHLQLIPYLVLRDAAGHLWCYQRGAGDARLHGRCSSGVGGHVEAEDAVDREVNTPDFDATLQRALLRELAEELGAGPTDLAKLHLLGLIYEGHTPVGRVHLGLLYCARWLPVAEPQPSAGESLRALGFRPATAVAADPAFELWSRLAAQHLALDVSPP